MSKKENIVRAAITIFQKKGIEKTKISDIVKLAGVAQGTYYLYFPSKLSVMPAIAEVMVEKMIKTVKKMVDIDASLSRQLEQIVEAIFLIYRDYHDVQAIMYAGLASTEHIKEWETVYAPFYKWLSDLLEKSQSSGNIRETMNINTTAKLIIGLVESAAEQVYLYDTRQDSQAEHQKYEVIEFLKHALGVDK